MGQTLQETSRYRDRYGERIPTQVEEVSSLGWQTTGKVYGGQTDLGKAWAEQILTQQSLGELKESASTGSIQSKLKKQHVEAGDGIENKVLGLRVEGH